MKCVEQCTIEPSDMIGKRYMDLTITSKRDPLVIISGCVVDCDNLPLSGAVIMVEEVDSKGESNEVSELGYTITDIHGKYCFGVRKNSSKEYKFTIYNPLVKIE